jgi:AcrR family transcriptional regulator
MTSKNALRKGEKTRQIFIEAGKRVFLRDGYLNTEITEIAREAGKSNGTFYIYFKNKSDLLDAMYDELMQESIDRFVLHEEEWYVHIQPPDWRALLQKMWEGSKRHAATLYALAQAALIDAHFAAVNMQLRQRILLDFERIIRGRQQAGFAKHLHPEYAAVSLETMVQHCMYQWLATPTSTLPNVDAELQAFETLVRLFDAALG